MSRACTVCSHERREEIDRALVGGSPNLSLSSLFGVSEAALRRHKANHLPAHLAQAEKAREVARADDLLEEVRDLQSRARAILDKAEGAGELRTALGAIREARGNLELLAKLLGELDEKPQINILLSPEWLELRAVIVSALAYYPQAREAVLGAIEDVRDG